MLAISPHVDDELTNELFRVPMLEDFNFDDLFLDFNKDVLPDLEVDLDDFSFDDDEHGEQQIISPEFEERSTEEMKSLSHEPEDNERASPSTSKEDGKVGNAASPDQASKERSKSSLVKASSSKGSQGKRKVDWTPELHRRFVQAVEYLGIDKAVPSRILEIMGVDCLTRHNVASHLQKFPPPAVPCVPPHSLYKPNKTITTEVHPNSKKLDSQILDAPSKERVDAAIGDVLAKPWLPLPLGLKPPSLDGVLVELQMQGISKVPPPK
ncbi:uncharacterized protein A4U43_C05F18230 [Asparagus officinalis]|uniref:HTH myb-type domain-containing protein n=1 Tax=Asparagus officinalis TaxID=4686 RepID=A0A5P1EXW5_ASPOF|nr:uncharacterized protein A4U43_C05F18230 [Asparagus officinalis]